MNQHQRDDLAGCFGIINGMIITVIGVGVVFGVIGIVRYLL